MRASRGHKQASANGYCWQHGSRLTVGRNAG